MAVHDIGDLVECLAQLIHRLRCDKVTSNPAGLSGGSFYVGEARAPRAPAPTGSLPWPSISPPPKVKRVLGRFYRTDDSRTRTTGGSGLGLAHALVTAHGGRITLNTAPGRGCTFRIVLPLPDSSPHGIADEAT
ncbi:ATP-binding protein [Streptomyces fungicidicus]|uniref:ATP-binding protein n=1 Tax=Streptomyces fungicidicus TaxID=68203 RepID=UPI0037A5FAAD